MTLPGRSSARVRALRELRRDRKKRDAEGVLIGEGFHLAQEALATGAAIRLAVVSPALERTSEGRRLRDDLRGSGAELLEVTEAALDSIQDARSPQPVLVVVERPRSSLPDALLAATGAPLVVLVDGLQDPGNLGSILRTADAAGATALVAAEQGADLFHPRTVRATMGSIFRLPASQGALDDAVALLRREGVRIVAADPSARDDYDRCDLVSPVAILLGAEGSGPDPERLAGADARVRIPMTTGVESLSAAAAGAVLLYEACRQRRRALRSSGGE